MERRSSNESDESDNLSQYFRSSSSRKSSLMTANPLANQSHQRSQSITPNDDDFSGDASRRLQSFLKSNDEKRPSRDSTDREAPSLPKIEGRKSTSTLGSFKFIKKKTKSVDYSSQVCSIKTKELFSLHRMCFSRLIHVTLIMSVTFNYKSDTTVNVNN